MRKRNPGVAFVMLLGLAPAAMAAGGEHAGGMGAAPPDYCFAL
jgi:hypothetical protein